MSKRTLIIYALFQETPQTDYFLDHGVRYDPDVDYVFVVNIENYDKGKGRFVFNMSEKFSNTVEAVGGKVMLRDNTGLDFGGYACVVDRLIKSNSIDKYDYLLFVNQTSMGPMFPIWYENKTHWSNLFTNLINERDKLVGSTISCFGGQNELGKFAYGMPYARPSKEGFTIDDLQEAGYEDLLVWSPHVQTWTFAIDKVGLKVAVDNGIFDYENVILDKSEIITQREVLLSTVLLKNNYNIASLLNCSQGKDFRGIESLEDARRQKFNYWGDVDMRGNFGEKVHPYETIFHKSNRDGRGVISSEHLSLILKNQHA